MIDWMTTNCQWMKVELGFFGKSQDGWIESAACWASHSTSNGIQINKNCVSWDTFEKTLLGLLQFFSSFCLNNFFFPFSREKKFLFFSGRGLVVSLGFEGRANADWPTKDGRGVEEDGRPVELDHKFPPRQHFWKCAPSHFFSFLNNNKRRRNTCINAVYIYTRRCKRQSKVLGNKYRTRGGHLRAAERAAPLIVKPTSFFLFTRGKWNLSSHQLDWLK